MKLAPVSFSNIPLGRPLPFGLHNADGTLLASRGYIFTEREALDTLAAHGTLFVDPQEVRQYRRAMEAQMHAMVNDKNTTLGQIADTQIMAPELIAAAAKTSDEYSDPDAPIDWLDMQSRANALMRDPRSLRFMFRLDKLQRDLSRMLRSNPDTVLFALIHLTASETRFYSATHAMLVSVVCMLAARTVLQWPEDRVNSLGLAALTMNISMTELQDQLAQQSLPLSSAQVEAIDGHSLKSVDMLKNLGIQDPDWLEAVRHHHDRSPGPLTGRPPAQQMARLMQRADIFGARMAPRATRFPLPSTAAMQGSYFDEDKKVDEAGAALVKAVGMYAPGSYVKLASGEVAVVTRRGATPSTPRVSVVISRQGMAMAEPPPRDTARPDFKIAAGLPAREVKVKLPLERLLTLV